MNLMVRQNFQDSGAPNTFIGGVAATIGTASLLATKLGISASRIVNFSVVGSDIQCRIGGSYVINRFVFSTDSLLTYYDDREGLVTKIEGQNTAYSAFYNCPNLEWVSFKNATELTFIPNGPSYIFSHCAKLKRIYMPMLSIIYGVGDDTGNFTNFNSGRLFYVNPFLQTCNAGGVEGDIARAISLGATVRYVTNFTAPNPITDLTAGIIYNTAVQLNFTAPSSTNAIDYYELYNNGVFVKNIISGDYLTGLTPSTSYNFTVIAVDIFYNKSVVSNSLSVSTTNIAWDITTGLVSYFKLDGNSNDSYGINNGVDTSVTYVGGKIGNAASFNGTTSLVTIADNNNLSFTNGSNDLPFSLSYWIKTTDTQFSIINKTNASFREYECQFSAGQLTFRLISLGDINNRLDQNITTSLNSGNWVHVVHTYNGGGIGGMKTYVNGILLISTAILTGTYTRMNNTTNPLILGALTSSATWFLNGQLDETSIYNTALTQTEIDLIYNSGNGITL